MQGIQVDNSGPEVPSKYLIYQVDDLGSLSLLESEYIYMA